MKFKVGYDRGGNPSWWLYAGNHKLVAWAGESFGSLYNARRAAISFKSSAYSAVYEVYLDADNAYRWRAWRGSDRVAASGESFSSKSAAEIAADNVRLNAGSAELED